MQNFKRFCKSLGPGTGKALKRMEYARDSEVIGYSACQKARESILYWLAEQKTIKGQLDQIYEK